MAESGIYAGGIKPPFVEATGLFQGWPPRYPHALDRDRNLNQTTGDWHRSTLLEITALPGGSRSEHPPEAAKVTEFGTRFLSTSSSDLTGCHRSVRMSCGSI